MNQDEDNGVMPDTEERPSIDIKEEEVFTTETPAHIKVEKQPKLLSCKYCTYTTRYQGNLVKHVRIHTGDKPYSCRFCGKRFASKSNHKSHETIHTGQKRLKCPHDDCTYRANTKECIAAHLMRCHGDSSVTVTPRRRKSAKTDKSPSQSPATATDLTTEHRRQLVAAIHEQTSTEERTNDLGGLAPPWATHAYMQTLLPHTVEVKPTLEELAEYVGTLHEAETLDQTSNRADSVDPATSLAANALVSASEPMRTQIPSISTFIRNRNHTDDLQQNMNQAAEVNSSPRPQIGLDDDTNQSLNSQPNEHSMDQQQAATSQDGGNPSTSAGLQGEAGQQQTPPPGTPIDLHAAQAAAAAQAGHQDPMSLVADENRSSVLSIELLQVFSKFGLDPQVIVDTLVLQGKLYRCVSCNIIFPEYSTFVLHKGCHGNRHPYQCHFCQVIFPDKFGFLTHFMQCPKK